MRIKLLLGVGLLLTFSACSQELGVDTNVAPPTDTDTDTDADSDTDTDTDTDSDADTDTDTGPDFCDETPSTSSPGGTAYGACVTGEIERGDLIESTNEGGSTHYDKGMYEDWFCASTEAATTNYDGPERVFRYSQGPNNICTITLTKECSKDLEMRIFRLFGGESCPNGDNGLVVCNRDAASGQWDDQSVRLTTTTNGYDYDVVVDAKNGKIANFTLEVECD